MVLVSVMTVCSCVRAGYDEARSGALISEVADMRSATDAAMLEMQNLPAQAGPDGK